MGTLNDHWLNFIYLVWQFQPHFPRGGIAHTAAGSHSLRKVKKNSSEIMGRALSLDSVCICQSVPQQSDKLLECHSKDCRSGKFFSLDIPRLQENAEQQQDHPEMHQLQEKQCKAIS